MHILTHNLGFPRVGAHRELKKALETYWKDPLTRSGLMETAARLRRENWRLQRDAGIGLIPSNDFSLYDHVLDHACLLGCAPARYLEPGRRMVNLDAYFAMARGNDKQPALEMTKWLDTNYHYLVPELEENQEFQLAGTKPFDEFKAALDLGIRTKPVLPGPVTFLRLSKCAGGGAGGTFDKLKLLPRLLPVYALLLQELGRLGAEWVQFDEPVLAMDLLPGEAQALRAAYGHLAAAAPDLSLLLCSYFGSYGPNLPLLLELPVRAVHLDATRAAADLDPLLEALPSDRMLSLGIVDGRNVWRNDYAASLALIGKARARLGAERLMLGPSCSLLHSPVSLRSEAPQPPEVLPWLAFAEEKLTEVAQLARLTQAGNAEHAADFRANQEFIAARRNHPRVRVAEVRDRLRAVREEDFSRRAPFPLRSEAQAKKLKLPLYPTTTIGSFPQTPAVRKARAQFKRGDLDAKTYRAFLEEETRSAVRRQEDLGLDVLVHGEFERNDMVEYFGEKLDGFAFTRNGWVQSYGSRCVKPPILYGDVQRPEPMTLEWTLFAQSLTDKPLKGMLTGPVTILKWSFPRDDQPLRDTSDQIALAIRDEVADLERAGIAIIQIDEPALREALPLRESEWKACLDWEVRSFRLASAGAGDETQIHTHMCYCDFGEILESIAAMDADVISLEASRSRMELLDVFERFQYPGGIGPGVWDIHSPRVPSAEEMADMLRRARAMLKPEHLWVNPDCGLKTRDWEEVVPSLQAMVAAAQSVRTSALEPV